MSPVGLWALVRLAGEPASSPLDCGLSLRVALVSSGSRTLAVVAVSLFVVSTQSPAYALAGAGGVVLESLFRRYLKRVSQIQKQRSSAEEVKYLEIPKTEVKTPCN